MDLIELGGTRRVGGMEGEEIVIRIYCMRGESFFFNKKSFIHINRMSFSLSTCGLIIA